MKTVRKHRSFSTAARAYRRSRGLVSLTPLIDVVFILLLFFMLASSFVDLHSIVLDAPASASGETAIEGALLVEVRLDGVRFAGQYVDLDDLARRVGQQVAKAPERRVLVRPALRVRLQDTVRVLDALAAAGARNLSLMDSPNTRGS